MTRLREIAPLLRVALSILLRGGCEVFGAGYLASYPSDAAAACDVPCAYHRTAE